EWTNSEPLSKQSSIRKAAAIPWYSCPSSVSTAASEKCEKESGRSSGRMLADDRFGLEKFTESNLSPFTSVSRHLVASEGGLRVFRRAINKHHPRLKFGSHIIRAIFAC